MIKLWPKMQSVQYEEDAKNEEIKAKFCSGLAGTICFKFGM